MNNDAISLLRRRYCGPGEDPKDIFPRVAKNIARYTPGSNGTTQKFEKQYLEMMTNLDFLPNSPCIKNAGYNNMNKACFVLDVEDSISGIFTTLLRTALIFKTGGGVGYNFSNLREKGASLNCGGEASGALSFLELYDKATEVVKQGGMRRGASMGVLNYDHPEIVDFIIAKARYTTLENFNLSILVTDDFMRRVDNNDDIHLKSRRDKRVTTKTMKARDIFWLAATYAWANGCPGLLFFDRINRDNPLHPGESIQATNPCGEVPLFPFESCCLGSINLSNCVTNGGFDFDKFDYLIEKGTFFLMGLNKSTRYLPEISQCYEMQNRFFRIGLGVMGFADMLMKLHILYDSAEALKMIDKLGKRMQRASKYAPLSVATLSIAPTGTLSILANCSNGIEPIYAPDYERRVVAGTFKESRNGEYLRTAHDVNWEWHLKILARWQQYIDNGVSKTVNLPAEASQSDVANAYRRAWELGCKGVTVYRDNSKDTQVYYSKPSCDGESCTL
jgi:ribonucleoside-diphosphate reductase alpha chain